MVSLTERLVANISAADADMLLAIAAKKRKEEKIQYEVEVYLYDCNKAEKIVLVDAIYPEKDIYKIQNNILESFNGYFNIKNNCL